MAEEQDGRRMAGELRRRLGIPAGRDEVRRRPGGRAKVRRRPGGSTKGEGVRRRPIQKAKTKPEKKREGSDEG